VHMFAVPETLQVWAHSDAAGTFDVISIDDTDSLNATVAVRSQRESNPHPVAAPGPWTAWANFAWRLSTASLHATTATGTVVTGLCI